MAPNDDQARAATASAAAADPGSLQLQPMDAGSGGNGSNEVAGQSVGRVSQHFSIIKSTPTDI